MKLLAALLIALSLTGCASLKTASTAKETFVACRAADVVTTVAILGHGGIELNPLMNALMVHSYVPFIAVEAGIAALAWYAWDKLSDTGKMAANAVSCLPPSLNAVQVHKMGLL